MVSSCCTICFGVTLPCQYFHESDFYPYISILHSYLGRRKKRRDANCHNELTQAACPDSCSAYVVVKETQSRNETQDIGTIIGMPQDIEFMRAPASTTQDDCYDAVGFFLDSNSTVRECDWLSSNPDPLDETRKISNCGYLNQPSDLGRMCKLSCGMCDW